MGQPLDGASVQRQGGFPVQALNQGTESAINSPSYFQHVINSFKVRLPLPKIGWAHCFPAGSIWLVHAACNSRFVSNFGPWVAHGGLSPTPALRAWLKYVSLDLPGGVGGWFSLLSIGDKNKQKRDHVTDEASADEATAPPQPPEHLLCSRSKTTWPSVRPWPPQLSVTHSSCFGQAGQPAEP